MSDLNIEIISKTQVIFSDKANLVVVPAVDGEIGFMSGHELVISNLKHGKVKVFDQNDELTLSVDVQSGFVEMTKENKLIILVD